MATISAALVNPHRFAEVRQAISKEPAQVLAFRGARWGEGAMHWVAMSDPGSWLDLVAVGGDPNELDRLGRTPLDWINDRLFMGAMAPHQRLGAPSRDRIRVATIKQAPVVWSSGGRPGTGQHSLNPVKLWTEAGLWDLLSLPVSEPGLWRGWQDGQHALHAWVGMADLVGADAVAERMLSMGIGVDDPDAFGRSAMWLAVDRWLENPARASASRSAIAFLRRHGADPDLDQGAQPPSTLAASRGASLQLTSTIDQALGM